MGKITAFLSLAVVSVGVWMITAVTTLNTVCTVDSSPLVRTSAACMSRLPFYFFSFALAIGGLIILMLSLLAMARRGRNKPVISEQPAITTMLHHEPESLRDVA